MKDLTKFKISKGLYATNLWLAIAIPYLQSVGFSLVQAMSLVSLSYISVTIFEYPTGVIGDYFSHKKSVVIGALIFGIAYLFQGFQLSNSYLYFAFFMMLAAFGNAMISGSDVSVLHKISKNFKKDLANYKAMMNLVLVFGTALGGFLFLVNKRIPYFISGLFYIISALFFCLIKVKEKAFKEKSQGNIYSKGIEGLRYIKTHFDLGKYIIFGAVIGGFYVSVKWFLKALYDVVEIDAQYVGILLSLFLFLVSLGNWTYGKYFKKIKLRLLVILSLVSICVVAFVNSSFIPIVALGFYHFIHGMMRIAYDVTIHKKLNDNIRASVTSFEKLLSRLFSSVYIFGSGFLIAKTSFSFLIIVTVIFLAVIIAVIFKDKIKLKR